MKKTCLQCLQPYMSHHPRMRLERLRTTSGGGGSDSASASGADSEL